MYSGYVENLEQIEFLKKKLSGHNILLGAAGTGKTNLAIAKIQEIVQQENVGNTLFVTYTNALTNTCSSDIKALFETVSLFDKPQVEVRTFHSLASAINRQVQGRYIQYLSSPKNIIFKAIYDCRDKYPDGKEEFAKDIDIFLDEIDFLESFDVSSLEEYENIVRPNRRIKSIRKSVRKYYWYVYEEYLKTLRRNYDCDFQGAGRYILDLGRHYALPKYKNIFIDEGQDFSPSVLKALVSLLDKGEEERRNLASKLFYVACTRAKAKLIICKGRDLPSIFPLNSENYNSITLSEFSDYFGDDQLTGADTKEIVEEMGKSIFLDKEDLLANFHLALMDAKQELDIQSPWMTPKVVDEIFIDKLSRLLTKGVIVKIAYGIADDKNVKNKNSITDDVVIYLKSRLKRYPNFKIQQGNSHNKMLICDDKFLINGSYNWLSYDGKTDREEGGTVIRNKNEIERVRKLMFNF